MESPSELVAFVVQSESGFEDPIVDNYGAVHLKKQLKKSILRVDIFALLFRVVKRSSVNATQNDNHQ